MNIIKENLFFVVMGAVVLLALILFVVIVQPLKSSNAKLEADVRGLNDRLSELVQQSGMPKTPKDVKLPNQETMRAAKFFHDTFDNQLKTAEIELTQKRLSETLPGLTEADRNEPGTYKNMYENQKALLLKKLAEKHITSGSDCWAFWNWGDGVPREEIQRIIASKEFHLISELVKIISSPELHVMQLDRAEVNPGEARTGEYRSPLAGRTEKRVEPYFDVYPFILEVRMPVERYEILLRELLRASPEVAIYIRKVSMARIDDDPRVTRQIPPLYIGVRVEGWALDYRLAPKDAGAGGLMGGRMGGPAMPAAGNNFTPNK